MLLYKFREYIHNYIWAVEAYVSVFDRWIHFRINLLSPALLVTKFKTKLRESIQSSEFTIHLKISPVLRLFIYYQGTFYFTKAWLLLVFQIRLIQHPMCIWASLMGLPLLGGSTAMGNTWWATEESETMGTSSFWVKERFNFIKKGLSRLRCVSVDA